MLSSFFSPWLHCSCYFYIACIVPIKKIYSARGINCSAVIQILQLKWRPVCHSEWSFFRLLFQFMMSKVLNLSFKRNVRACFVLFASLISMKMILPNISQFLVILQKSRFSFLFFLEVVVYNSRFFSIILRRHHCRWRAEEFHLGTALIVIEPWGIFSLPIILRHGAFVHKGRLRYPVTFTSIAEHLKYRVQYQFSDSGLSQHR